MKSSSSKDWQLTAAYYAIYHSIYSIMMEIGIKSEIHSCTIEAAKTFLSRDDIKVVQTAFKARIDAQYYVNKIISERNYQLIIKKAPLFLVNCRNMVLDLEKIQSIRKKLS